MRLNPELHNSRTLKDQLETVIDYDPNSFFAGSLGRAAVYQYLLGDPMVEYRSRHGQPYQRYSGAAADLDLVAASTIAGGEDNEFGPFEVDTKSFRGRQVAIIKQDGKWLLKSANRSFEAEIKDDVMEPIETQTVYGVACNTLPPQTLLTLLGVTGTLRPQDIHAKEVLTWAIQESGITPMPEQYYEPFRELGLLNEASTFNRARLFYRTMVPPSIRKPFAPMLQPIKERLLH